MTASPGNGQPRWTREFKMLDGRSILIDRRSVTFVCQGKEDPENTAVIAFKMIHAKPVPIAAPYAEVVAWWKPAPEAAA